MPFSFYRDHPFLLIRVLQLFMVQQTVKKITGPFFFLLGLLLLAYIINKFGAGELFQAFRNLGFNVGFVLVLPLFWYASHALAWYLILEETGNHVTFSKLLRIKLVGEAINTLTPVSFMGGDPVRIYLLQKKMPGTLSTASVVLDRTMQSLAVIVLLFVGLVAAWLTLSLPTNWKVLFPVITVLLAALMWFFIHRQRKGIFEFLSNVLSKLGIKRHQTERLQKNIEEIDGRISQFYHHNPRRFVIVLGFHFLGRLVGVLEIYIIAQLLNIPLAPVGALLLASLSILVNVIFVFIPGSMGVMEGAYGALCLFLNLDPISGVAIQLVRRLRAIFWIFIGLLFMLFYSKSISRKKQITVPLSESET